MHLAPGALRLQEGEIVQAQVDADLDAGTPSTGVLLVEVWYNYDQILRLPWITAFLSDPVLLHLHTFMPLTSAEPTSTP